MIVKLEKLQVKNYRSIKDSGSIEGITKIFALIGRNNAGKSSLLKSIEVLFCERSLELRDFHKATDEDISISGTVYKEKDEEETRTEVSVLFVKETEKVKYFVNGEEVTKANYKKNIPKLFSISDIRDPNDTTTLGQKTTLLQNILKNYSAENKDEYAKQYSELSEKLTELKKQESEEISKILTNKFNEVIADDDFTISVIPDVNIDKGIVYTTNIRNGGIPDSLGVDILNSGTGLQSMFLLSLLEVYGEVSLQNDDAILLVEEPEVYLHPTYQRRMFAALRRISKSNQVIFTTHSPIMISDIWLTESVRQIRLNKNGETEISNVKIEDVIDELGIRYEDVLNPKVIVFVEGKNDVPFYKFVGLDNAKIKLIPTDSFRAIQYFAFIRIITSENVKSEFVLITDSDGESEEDRVEYLISEIKKQFETPPKDLEESLKNKIFVLKQYAIEAYFINEDTLRKSFPVIEQASIETFVKEYWEKHDASLEQVKKGELTKDKFKQFLKPKNVFVPYKHEKAEEAYREFWKDSPTFLTVRRLILSECASLGKSGTDPFTHILNNSNVKVNEELSSIKDAIIKMATA